MTRTRQLCVILHRQIGLTLALVLCIVSITGVILVFVDELEPWTAPEVFQVTPPKDGAAPLHPIEIRDRVLKRYPDAVINYLPLQALPDRSFKLILERIDPASGHTIYWSSEWNELFVNPYTAEDVAHRNWGDLSEGAVNLIPFLYRLHWALALDPIGIRVLGIVALIWTFDCFIGLYLTFPPRSRSNTRNACKNWWRRWLPAWRIKTWQGRFRFAFDLHRAGGLWLWAALFVFAWSSVFMNLSAVYDPVMRVFGYTRIDENLAVLPQPKHQPSIGFSRAAQLAPVLAAKESQQRGLSAEERGKQAISYEPERGIYYYSFTASNDFTNKGGQSTIVFDAANGNIIDSVFAQGDSGANTVTRWLEALHMANVWGLPYRIAVALLGLLIIALAVTGVIIWNKKRAARARTRSRPTPASTLSRQGQAPSSHQSIHASSPSKERSKTFPRF